MRPRRRYLIFSARSPVPLSAEDLREALRETMRSLFGERALALSGFELVLYDAAKGLGVVRCHHTHVDAARAALAMTTSVRGLSVALTTLRVTGTLRRAARVVASLEPARNSPAKLMEGLQS